jgi:hypothetical protein
MRPGQPEVSRQPRIEQLNEPKPPKKRVGCARIIWGLLTLGFGVAIAALLFDLVESLPHGRGKPEDVIALFVCIPIFLVSILVGIIKLFSRRKTDEERRKTEEERWIVGTVRSVQLRTRTASKLALAGGYRTTNTDVLTFVIDRVDGSGNNLPPVPVQMVGTINGVLSDGHTVAVRMNWKPGVTLTPTEVFNQTTGATVWASKGER